MAFFIQYRTATHEVLNWKRNSEFINLRSGVSQTQVDTLPAGIARGRRLTTNLRGLLSNARNHLQEMSDLRNEAQALAAEIGEELSRLITSSIRVSTTTSGEIDASQRWVNAFYAYHNLCANVISANRSIVPLRAAMSPLRSGVAVGVRAFLLGHTETDWNSTFRSNAYEIRSNFGRGSAILLTNARNPIRNFFDLGL